jgi:hypothetical protein
MENKIELKKCRKISLILGLKEYFFNDSSTNTVTTLIITTINTTYTHESTLLLDLFSTFDLFYIIQCSELLRNYIVTLFSGKEITFNL